MSAKGIKAVIYSVLLGLLIWLVTVPLCVYLVG